MVGCHPLKEKLLRWGIGFQFTFSSPIQLIPINISGNEHHNTEDDESDD